jgi:ribosomal protein S18 acetylase RimI-like enzyme
VTTHPLDDPVWHALAGPHAHFAERRGRAVRYPAEMSPFAAVAAADAAALADLAALVPAGGFVALSGPAAALATAGFRTLGAFEVIQMVCDAKVAPPARALATLGSADVPDMLALVARTEPGPFGPRTIEMGRYLGVRDGGRLVAMAGERLRLPGYTEVSGVCTAPEARGRGLAEALVCAAASDIQARGDAPFLHVRAGSPSEATATALYERVGFRARRRTTLAILQRLA